MGKNRVIGVIVTGLVLFLMAAGLVLSSCYSTERKPPPLYAFASDRSGAGDIFVLDQAGQIRNLTPHPEADWDPAWSPDGKMLAFTSHRTGNSDIWLLDVAESAESLAPRRLTHDPAWDYSPTWSPSGQTVAFVSERDGDGEIFVQNLEEDSALQLTFNNEMDRLPAWSPDGQYIAFAAVRDGIERIYRIRPDGTDEQMVTVGPINGTSPAWSPDGQRLAFVGWDEKNRPGIYIIGPQAEDIRLLHEGYSWIGSLDWVAEGQWLTFTAWSDGSHELYALPVTGGAPTRITTSQAWDDFLVINPQVSFTPTSLEGVAQAAPAPRAAANQDFAAGVNIADLGLAYMVNDMGSGWARSYVNWATVEQQRGEFRWVDPDNIVQAFGDQEVKILMRVHGTPAWARPADTMFTHPPTDLRDFANFMTALAARYKGRVAAYEIWNEPNLNYEWGNQDPDPVAYTEMLKTAYRAVKAVDPEALVISGGLATTGGGSATAYGDLAFLEEMYQAGAKGYFDAFGSHPYAFGRPPDEADPDGLSLERIVQQRQVMENYGDEDTPIWITEVGWVLNSSWDLDEHEQVGVTEAQQAEYLARAYARVRQEWPFVQAMFLFNLDFSTVPWYPAAEPMRWYAILNPDRTPRPAFTTLREQMR